MTKFILHGGFERAENELNQAFYRELVEDIPDKGTLLLCSFASTHEEEEIKQRYQEQTDRIKSLIDKKINFLLADKGSFLEQARLADAIHFRGGHTPKLLSVLRSYPTLSSILTGKTVSGSSAGAYALAMYGPGHSEKGIREGLGLVPIRLICHYESQELPPDSESCAELEMMTTDLELVTLRDFEWRVFN